ncbi:MAG TPA: hypothetical protein VK619_19225 [Pyrinomonadaceae bacterium]|nr:hypothetical protein [Pyrinomonadaceae bacterium]
MATNSPFAHHRIDWSRLGRTLINALLGLMLVAFLVALSSANAQAQSAGSICTQRGFQESRVNLNGVWEVDFSVGATRHIAKLFIKGDIGVSGTEYYDDRLGRKRRIAQALALCQSTFGVVILGFRPTDIDTNQTGSDLTYNADNFVISRQPDGTLVAFNYDAAETLVKVDIKFIRELNSDELRNIR